MSDWLCNSLTIEQNWLGCIDQLLKLFLLMNPGINHKDFNLHSAKTINNNVLMLKNNADDFNCNANTRIRKEL